MLKHIRHCQYGIRLEMSQLIEFTFLHIKMSKQRGGGLEFKRHLGKLSTGGTCYYSLLPCCNIGPVT